MNREEKHELAGMLGLGAAQSLLSSDLSVPWAMTQVKLYETVLLDWGRGIRAVYRQQEAWPGGNSASTVTVRYPPEHTPGAWPQGEANMSVLGMVISSLAGLNTTLKIIVPFIEQPEIQKILKAVAGAIGGALQELVPHSAEARVAVESPLKIDDADEASDKDSQPSIDKGQKPQDDAGLGDDDEDTDAEANGPGEDLGGDASDPD